MIINKVEIENFFCYVDKNEFIFDKGLNIVSAKNSGGKSHLFNAFHWTFFNNVYVDKEEDSTKKEWKSADKVVSLPDIIIANAADGATLKSKVKITLTAEYHENDESKNDLVEYHFEKEMIYRKSELDIIPTGVSELLISYVRDGETKYLNKGEFKWFLDKVFPVSIRKFMWFQGETVDELYDFGRPATLKNAINEISYFPIYENLVAITKASETSISKKIDTELKKVKKFSVEQEKIISDIEYAKNRLKSIDDKIIDTNKETHDLEESISKEYEKLKGFGKYSDLKTKLNKLDYEIKSTNDKIELLTTQGKEKFISKWMLNKCDDLIKASSKNIDLLSKEVKEFQKSDNPVPITLPGPEYVQKMLDDHVCYICERPVEDGSASYLALQSRMEDFRNNQIQKIKAENLTELNKFRRNLLSELPEITEEVNKNEEAIEKLIVNRKKFMTQRDNVFSESGIEKVSEITIGSTNADQIVSKIKSLESSKLSAERRLINSESDKEFQEQNLQNLEDRKAKIIQVEDGHEITELTAKKYIDVINKALIGLKNDAYESLINEIVTESNVLYSKYLGGKTQGEIEIDKGVRIVDKLTKRQLSNLNTAELTAQKLAVTNAFLSLSEKKMNRSFPLLADAPTSDFDDDNTLSLTENLSGSFNQIIIMSKDYNKLKEDERVDFIKKAHITKYYELVNDLIDINGPESRTNKKTYINTVK